MPSSALQDAWQSRLDTASAFPSNLGLRFYFFRACADATCCSFAEDFPKLGNVATSVDCLSKSLGDDARR